MPFLFLSYLIVWRPFVYIGIFIGMMIEGEAVLFSTVLLAVSNVLNGYISIPITIVGLILGDYMWYYIGVKLVPRYKRLHRFVHRVARPFDKRLQRNPFRIIFLSKFVYGMHRSVLMRAGEAGVSIRQFTKIILISNVVWFSAIAGIAYTFGRSIHAYRHYLRYLEVLLLLGVLGFFIIEHIVGRISERALEEEELDEKDA